MTTMHRRLRPAAVAGRFYEADSQRCAREAAELCAPPVDAVLPDRIVGALVPHAGWMCSGRIAGETFAAMRDRCAARVFVMTGSVHTVDLTGPALDEAEAWATPTGEIEVDGELRAAIAGLDGFDVVDAAHVREHAIEVQLPLMRAGLGGEFRIVPVMIPPRSEAAEWGDALGELLAGWREPVAMIGSVDLTHYGPNYRFTPNGTGEAGRRWAHEVNDRRLLERVEAMDAAAVVYEAATHRNTCGGGAVAATIACCRRLGATRGVVIEHTDSTAELTAIGMADAENSVGYAGVVFGDR